MGIPFSDLNVTVRRSRLLRPHLTVDLVPRPRLVEHLNRGLDQPLIALITPAGFGKTTLLCEWLAQCPYPAAWLSLDQEQGAAAGFGAYFISALRTIEPQAGAATLALIQGAELPPAQALAAALEDDLLALSGDMVLVLDDYHTIEDPEVHGLLSTLLRHPPPGLHLVIASRAEPPLPLARLRALGQLTELRAADLRFTVLETAAFLARTADLSLDPADAEFLQEHTEGWAAGLRLASLSLRHNATQVAKPEAFLSRRLRGAVEFLVDDVLALQPSDVQEFLLNTSVVERFCAGLCDVLVTGSPAVPSVEMLEQVLRQNLYLTPLGDEPAWFRYHAIFRNALRERLFHLRGAAFVAELHARAARWFAGEGLVDEAITHALAAGEEHLAGTIVAGNVKAALRDRKVPALEAWLQRLPRTLVQQQPELMMAMAWTAHFRNRWTARDRLVDAVSTLLERDGGSLDPAVAETLYGELHTCHSLRLFAAGDGAGAAKLAARAMTLLPRGHRYGRELALYVLMLSEQLNGRAEAAARRLEEGFSKGDPESEWCSWRALAALLEIRQQAGELYEAERTGALLLRVAGQQQDPNGVAWARYHLGMLAYEHNDLDIAIKHFGAAMQRPDETSLHALRESAFGLSLAYLAQERDAEAGEVVSYLTDRLRESANIEGLSLVAAFEARLALLRGDIETAARWLETGVPESNIVLLILTSNPAITRAQILLARVSSRDLTETEALIEQVLGQARAAHHTRRVIEVLALKALALRRRGDLSGALVTLEEALSLALPGGFIRTFVDLGPELAELLRTLRPRTSHTAYVDRVLAAFPRPGVNTVRDLPTRIPSKVLDALTDREIDVLALLGKRLSNKEIAQELVISPLTVKVHASNIYAKLSVGGRREAVRKARSLGLLPSL